MSEQRNRTSESLTEEVLPGTPLSRRAVVRGGAWAVPAIAVAVAAPAAAASPDAGPSVPIGALYTSSSNIYDSHLDVGALLIPAFDHEVPIPGSQTITVVITYSGVDTSFSLVLDPVPPGFWTVVSQERTRVMLMYVTPAWEALEAQAPSIYWSFNTPPAANTITISGSAQPANLEDLSIQPETGTGSLIGPPAAP